jgi:hypothetical protein
LRPVVKRDFGRLPELIAQAGDVPEYIENEQEDHNDQEPTQLSFF